MKKALLSLILFAVCSAVNAQDIIRTTKGKEIKCQVMEVSSDVVKYTLENTATPLYTEKACDVDYIQYANGSKENFIHSESEDDLKDKKKMKKDLKIVKIFSIIGATLAIIPYLFLGAAIRK